MGYIQQIWQITITRIFLFLVLCVWVGLACLMNLAPLHAQQQNPDEVPGVGTDRSSDFGNDTNYGLSPQALNESFDRKTNPVDYPNPEEVNRNTISTSLTGVPQGFLYMEWEHLLGRMFGLVLGFSFYASELSLTRRFFEPAGLDTNSFMNLGAILGFAFYVNQQYARGLSIQVKFGGGLISGSYTESGTTLALTVFDFYGSAFGVIAYRLNITPRIALSPLLIINPNVVIVSGTYNNALVVPSYFALNGHSDLLGLSAPADLIGGGTILLFMHFGFGIDLTFTF